MTDQSAVTGLVQNLRRASYIVNMKVIVSLVLIDLYKNNLFTFITNISGSNEAAYTQFLQDVVLTYINIQTKFLNFGKARYIINFGPPYHSTQC